MGSMYYVECIKIASVIPTGKTIGMCCIILILLYSYYVIDDESLIWYFICLRLWTIVIREG